MGSRAFVASCAGLALDDWERSFFREANPWGFILFARNVANPEQVQRLTASLRDCVGRDAPVLVDQEGGRVQRLRPPHWENYPSARTLGAHARDKGELGLIRASGRLVAEDLRQSGINICCAPVLDLQIAGQSEVIGSRAFSFLPEDVARFGRTFLEGLNAGGVGGVIKHIPGHGRATVDSHHELPVVEASLEELRRSDFRPFRALNDVPMAMTCHLVYRDIDPDSPATTSATVIRDVIRGEIGFNGLLFSDDVSMKALEGTIAGRVDRLLNAGCDIALYCFGRRPELEEVASVAPVLMGESLARAERALDSIGPADEADLDALRSALAVLAS